MRKGCDGKREPTVRVMVSGGTKPELVTANLCCAPGRLQPNDGLAPELLVLKGSEEQEEIVSFCKWERVEGQKQ